ncbi:predicted protein [Histoplasma mississippiense (nom. inval.)]|uniref:predicted protein n=1 Tax=Ajellomyces capsulatus (strain NAm1 / WU24) TaxID=2059318 RepID=UPI000157BE56|nr:predicted protein [Histoplasma mississippiense (nom. inval.)]EDN06457.1 predicted protein [Histoplasma mississippiense (nom. inval.)]
MRTRPLGVRRTMDLEAKGALYIYQEMGGRLGLRSPGIEARRSSSQQYPRTKSENRTHAAVASLPQLSHANHRGGTRGKVSFGCGCGCVQGERMAVRWAGGSASPVIYTCGELWVAPEEKDKDTANQGYPHLPTKGR